MKRKYLITALLLLINAYSYSQTVLIDSAGDTSLSISLSQMDRIYVELIQKDSLMEQSYVNAEKEESLYQIIDSSKKDINTLREVEFELQQNNATLAADNARKDIVITRSRLGVLTASLVAVLAILIR